MITEIAVLNIKKNESKMFETTFSNAQSIICKMKGYIKHELLKSMEESDKYVLIVRWETLKDHTESFRKSNEYNEWKNLLHHFYEPFPMVNHYEKIF